MKKTIILLCSFMVMATTASALKKRVIQGSNTASESEVAVYTNNATPASGDGVSTDYTIPSDIQVVNLEKPGKLKSAVSKTAESITALKINGVFNTKDLIILLGMPNIEYLDLADAEIANGNLDDVSWTDKNGKHKAIRSGNDFILTTCQPLRYLKLPKNVSKVKVYGDGDFVLNYFQCNDGDWVFYRVNENGGPNRQNRMDVKFKNIRLTSGSPRYDKSMLKKSFSSGKIYYGGGERQQIDTLFLASKSLLGCKGVGNVDPEYVVFDDTHEIMLNTYRGTNPTVDLSRYDYLSDYTLAYSNASSVNFGSKIKAIPVGCFYGCKNLKEVNCPSVTEIGENAFAQSSLKELKLPAQITKLNGKSFEGSSLETIELSSKYAPETTSFYPDQIGGISFIVPQGTGENYAIGDWKNVSVIEKGTAKSSEFVLEKIGSLKNFITPENAKSITSLTLKGIMDDTEFSYIRQCTNLRFLDMTYLYVMKSAATQQAEESEKKFVMALLGATADLAEQNEKAKLDNGTGDAGRYLQAAVGKAYIEQAIKQEQNKKVVADANCYIPEKALDGLNALSEIRFPMQLKTLDLLYQAHLGLKKVVLPPALEKIKGGCFASCKNLGEVEFPSTLEYLAPYCFSLCNLHKVDLKNTKIQEITNSCFTGAISEFYGSKVLTKMTEFDSRGVKLYLYTREKPSGYIGNAKEIHIPRGCKAGYSGISNENIIDDIDL